MKYLKNECSFLSIYIFSQKNIKKLKLTMSKKDGQKEKEKMAK